MPTEIVTASTEHESFGVRVGWSGESGHVQVASVTEDHRSLWWQVLGYDPGAVAKLGDKIRTVAQAEGDDEDRGRLFLNTLDVMATADGLYVSLDRQGVNRLVRLLRKARDAAFGRDE